MAKIPDFQREYEDALERERDWILRRGGSIKAVEAAKLRLFSGIVRHGRSLAAGISSPDGRASFLRALDDWHFAHRTVAHLKREKTLSKASVMRVLGIHLRNARTLVEQAKMNLSPKDEQHALQVRNRVLNLLLQVRSGRVEGGVVVSSRGFKRLVRQLPDSTFTYRIYGRDIPEHITGQLVVLAQLHRENAPLLSDLARSMRVAKGTERLQGKRRGKRKG